RGLLAEVGLAGRQNSLIGSYSRGMRQRLGIARTLLGDPQVVFLDEPTLGLDPRGQQELLQIIQRIAAERGAGVVFCSHQLSEVESVCDDVIILNEGRVVADGPVDQVTARTGAPRFLVLVDPPSVDKAVQALQSDRITVSTNRQMNGQIEVELGTEDPEQASAIRREILQSLVDARIDVLGFTNRVSRLEEVFLSLTQGVAS
ncbi:MAG: ABC transporter ATP-binding protein, partial [Acidimicrobiia bacterium]|nr:ABC transporter ATP-binding protein [Acidimicrobiia bacterium]